MSLDDLRLFAEVARHHGYTRAAAATGVPKATLSRVVARLEGEAGTALLHRSTRRVGLTPAGAALFERVRPAIEALDAAMTELRASAGEPNGVLRLTATTDLAATLAPALATLVARYPRLRVETLLTLRLVDLVGERVDAALRVYAAPPRDPTVAGRRLMELSFGWFAAPSYLARRGEPADEAELCAHDVIGTARGPVPARVVVDDSFAGLALIRAGAGIGMLPSFLCGDSLADGSIVRVLPDVTMVSGQLWLVYPIGGLNPNVAALRDAVLEHLPGRVG